ncbi:response regulator [Nostoc sphaeroides CHAB 2801]|uniref:response regulator n=1 Tax=Nostoc sphaeroides TaxID=446679 RepID=UPI001E3CFC68|nr:response regulator [Nostoc sphaeroides]MCC5627252.1 response regulator [Nostoc sphaeroides CHAB 2801]
MYSIPSNYSSLQGLRVLLVDDNVDFFCSLMTLLLQLYGVEVQTAFSVQQALEIFEQWQPDVLVSDIALSKKNCYALIQQVRTKVGERGEVVLAIAVTGYANKNMLQRALCAGFDLWFTKPLDFDEFFAVLTCLAICQQSSGAIIAQRILDHVPKHADLSLSQQHISNSLIN